MAKQVEGISEKVELCAKKEFLEKGYVDASLRTIAAEAGTTTGTIYSRYGGKEGLHLEEFQLLVKSSYGTRFQDFVEHLVELETDYTYKFMEAIGLRFKDGKPLTKNFMHIMNKALFESFFEVIRHDMSEEEAWEYIEMLEKYHSAGWNIIYGECCSIND